MQITSTTAVLLTAIFLMPGFVWSAVLSMLIPRRANQAENRFLEFFTLSCINGAIWSAPLYYIVVTDRIGRHPVWFSIFLFGVVLVSPVLMGLVVVRLQQRDALARLLRRFGFRTVNYIKSAWDWHFSRQKAMWAVITLKDGSVIYGYFGSKSFAGEEPRDIYLQKVYKPETNGFATTEDNSGVLIAADQISTLEFYTDAGVSNAEDLDD